MQVGRTAIAARVSLAAAMGSRGRTIRSVITSPTTTIMGAATTI